jgi:hypothetical protein
MKVTTRLLTLSAFTIFTIVLPSEVTAQEGGAGLIEKISGTVFWRQKAADKGERLDPRSDAARRLYPGEQVRCVRRSKLIIRLGRRRKQVPCADWFTIPPLASSKQSEPFKRLINEYGKVGGVERGESSQVFAPSHHSAVMPESFVIRWVPGAAACTLSLTIKGVGNQLVWRQDNVIDSSGSLQSATAKRHLTRYRNLAGLGPLTLTLDDSCRGETQVTFSVLSVQNERLLEQELAFWDKEPGPLVRHLGRASAFSSYRMYPQAADEYEAALRAAPGSRDLLTKTIRAHRRTGNFTRAEVLEKRLPPATSTR